MSSDNRFVMTLPDHINTFDQLMLRRHGEKLHKVAVNAGFT